MEEDSYAADELVELSEEILVQIAAVGVSVYLSQNNQSESFNDFILRLFTDNANDFNAGPLYRWAAHMLRDLQDEQALRIKPLFWEGEEINDQINRLSKLRNAVMHGFFVLPAERNISEANHLAMILNKLIDINLFKTKPSVDCHFMRTQDGLSFFNGSWEIEGSQWLNYSNCFDFGLLTQQIIYENSSEYEADQSRLVKENLINIKTSPDIKFFRENKRGACLRIFHPNDDSLSDYAQTIDRLQEDSQYLILFQNLEPLGINFTADFILSRLVKRLADSINESVKGKNLKKELCAIRPKIKQRPVVIIHNIQVALFHPAHILSLVDLFYENDILLLGYGIQHHYLNQRFNLIQNLMYSKNRPSHEVLEDVMNNYLRFKGPNPKQIDEQEDFTLLHKITIHLNQYLSENDKVLARRFSDENQYPIEFVHESFEILSPFYKVSSESFIPDELNYLYNFPKELTESSRTLFSIGRRDTKLEYQHKILSRE